MRAARGTRLIIAVLTLAAPVLTTLFAKANHYDHPFIDEWAFTPFALRVAAISSVSLRVMQ